MKKFILAIAAAFMAASMASAQDMAQATELYNNGATAISMKNWKEALDYFQKAMEMGKTIGADADELVTNCKNAIPGVSLEIAKDLITDKKYDESVAELDKVVAIATEYENAEVAEKAKELVPQVWMQKGVDALKLKDFASAEDGFKKSYAIDTTSGKAALYLGQALAAQGKTEEAIEAFQHASWNGEEATAKKQVSNIYVKAAQAGLKTQKYAVAVENAVKANEYLENANAYLIAGQASQKLSKNSDAIQYFEKYLEMNPNAKNAPAITFTVAALYQGAKNNAKALENYKKVQNDPQLGQQAQAQIKALSK
jgi:tetratricopeptide (TPR) repeat protein